MAGWVWNPDVVCTELEDGAVLLNLASGFYYSLNAAALEVWRALETSSDVDAVARAAASVFGADPETIRADVAGLIEDLGREALVLEADAAAGAAFGEAGSAPPGARSVPAEWVSPELVKHDEPLHEITVHPFDPQLPLAE